MTELKVNQENQKTSEETPQFGVLSPCPPSTVPFRVLWSNGVPMLPDGMSEEEFFDQVKEISDDELDALIEEDMEEAEREEEALSTLGNIGKIQAIVGNDILTTKYAVKLLTREEVRLRYKMMAYIKDALRPVCSWKAPVLNCKLTPIGDHVTVYRTENDGRPSAKIGPVVHDNNTWVCPFCSLNIAYGRCKDIREIVWHAKKMDLEAYHMTVTMAHDEWDKLSDMLQEMKAALRDFWGQRRVKDWFKSCFVHRISTMEITKGFDEYSNGWHPHLHILLIGSKDVPVEVLEKDLSDEWIKALRKNGRDGKEGIALKIEQVSNIEHYLTKVPCEIALNNVTKHGHGAHMTFFQMVAYAVKSGSSAIKADIAEYVREYYKATKGLHQMQMTREIYKYFGIEKKSDQELAAQETEKVVEDLIVADAREWRKKIDHDDIANIWLMARRGERSEIKAYLNKKGVFTTWDNEEDYKRYMNKFYGK